MSEYRYVKHFIWTPEAVELLTAGWRAGDPTRIIAERIGTSRASVNGKARNLKLGKHPNAGLGFAGAFRKFREDNPEWSRQIVIANLSKANPRKRLAACRGVDIPPELDDLYRHLRRSKKLPQAEVLRLIEAHKKVRHVTG